MPNEKKILRYWVITAEGDKLWFQNSIEFLNYIKGMESFKAGNLPMTIAEWKAMPQDPRP